MGELPITSGSVEAHAKVSFFTQTPWIFNGSVRDNILFGQKYDPFHYTQVVRGMPI